MSVAGDYCLRRRSRTYLGTKSSSTVKDDLCLAILMLICQHRIYKYSPIILQAVFEQIQYCTVSNFLLTNRVDGVESCKWMERSGAVVPAPWEE